MVKSVLESILVYWFSLIRIPASIIHGISRRMFQFLWAGSSTRHKFHLTNWESISVPKKMGGWGLKNLDWFSSAQLKKLMERALWEGSLE